MALLLLLFFRGVSFSFQRGVGLALKGRELDVADGEGVAVLRAVVRAIIITRAWRVVAVELRLWVRGGGVRGEA